MRALKLTFLFYCILIATSTSQAQMPTNQETPSTKDRVIVLADMGHDPDEEQQITHMLMCSNQFELEGLITVTGRFFRPNPPPGSKDLRPQLFHALIDAYEKVYPNLKCHADGWHEPDYLRSIVSTGQVSDGIADTGPGKSTPGSDLIIAAATKADERPLNIVINAGSNTLAQALIDYRARSTNEELAAFVSKLRVYDNGGQDDAGAWICNQFPDLHYVRSVEQSRAYGGPSNTMIGPSVWEPFEYSVDGQHEWAKVHVQSGHGPLGELYPNRAAANRLHFIEGGGTIPLADFYIPGLTNRSEPSWGGWSGRYSAEKHPEVYSHFSLVRDDELKMPPFAAYTDGPHITDHWIDPESGKDFSGQYAPVWRWRRAMWNDLKARMDWCVEPFEKANHHPKAVLENDHSDRILFLTATPGQTLTLSAAGSSDPDGDTLSYRWWNYPEAGRVPYGKSLDLQYADKETLKFVVPEDAAGKELHIILEVWDQHPDIPLVDYRRVLITVAPLKGDSASLGNDPLEG